MTKYAITAVKWDADKKLPESFCQFQLGRQVEEDGEETVGLFDQKGATCAEVIQKITGGDTFYVCIFDKENNPILTDTIKPYGQSEELRTYNTDGYTTDSLRQLPELK